ncbi:MULTISPECIES: glycoside hydrolase family 1 protein [Cryobacterium]|uniref:Beta-glucosidase n=1 Tax=Cryobacterium levicorallinum TaxID=995038 RepID=A0A1I3BJ30_9MICO|nr:MULTISPECIES: family 1 glycosylhydrolase [Cryobacterium]TFB82103.1 glycosyl hydrolase family protein [Cryobacterium levicorallinum]TFD57068.1 glycosyl hydrolase family protein [Cryobacterium sp. Hh38]GEP28043.1 beta-glucosidase [Cryobacterium levicorallinum]SFH62315.1 beta-glucosidase [Cryobacterium levicorallinum]
MNPTPRTPASTRAVAARDWEHRAGELGDGLPTGFEVAVATSAFQIEGAARDGGRGDSVWDSFSQRSGRIRDGSNASVSADHIKNYEADAAILRDLGVDAYRFSLGWTRLQPEGRGPLNRNGLAFYDRLLDALLADGIRSTATLSHWDLPAALRGGWLNRDTAGRFADYAHAVGEAFGDRIDAWVTLNEPATVTTRGYALGTHAPGRTLLFDALPTAHHQLLAHGLAVQGLRAADVRGRIGLVNSHTPVQSATDRDQDRSYAVLYDLLQNRLFADPVLLGHYPDPLEPFAVELRTLLEADPADLRTIQQPLDFYGLSYTGPARIAAGATVLKTPDGQPIPVTSWPFHLEPFREHPTTSTGDVNAPGYLAVALSELAERYPDLPPVYLSLAGGAFWDQADARHQVHDPARIDYLAEHLVAALDATATGAPAAAVDLAGVAFWSLLDGFEWDDGYTQPTGLVHVDFADDRRTRTPKSSYRWLQHALTNR